MQRDIQMRAPVRRAIIAGMATVRASLPKNGTGNPVPIIEIADDAETSAATHEIHDHARRLLAFAVIAFDLAAPEQSARIEIAALIAQIAVDVGIVDRAIDARGIRARDRQRPDGKFPIAHMQRRADDRAELAGIALENFRVPDVDPRRVGDDLIDAHRLGHDAAEIFPMLERDGFALVFGLFRKRDPQIVERAVVPFRIDDGRQAAPAPRRKVRCRIERDDAHDADDGAQQHIFEPELQVTQRRGGDGRGQKSIPLILAKVIRGHARRGSGPVKSGRRRFPRLRHGLHQGGACGGRHDAFAHDAGAQSG